jgi:hypothetical protein
MPYLQRIVKKKKKKQGSKHFEYWQKFVGAKKGSKNYRPDDATIVVVAAAAAVVVFVAADWE